MGSDGRSLLSTGRGEKAACRVSISFHATFKEMLTKIRLWNVVPRMVKGLNSKGTSFPLGWGTIAVPEAGTWAGVKYGAPFAATFSMLGIDMMRRGEERGNDVERTQISTSTCCFYGATARIKDTENMQKATSSDCGFQSYKPGSLKAPGCAHGLWIDVSSGAKSCEE